MNASDRFEAETTELPALSEDDVEEARARRRITPAGFIPVQPSEPPCVDPAYVRYLERELAAAQAAADSARSVFAAVGAHNADLTERLRESEGRRMELLEELLALQTKEVP